MESLKLFFWLTIILLFSTDTVFSQDYLFDIEKLNVEDGLPHRNAYQIQQDDDGYIWISSQGNISRYTGNQFEVYNYTELGIGESGAALLAIGRQKHLWYCELSPDGYSGVIDTKTGKIHTVEDISGGRLHSDSILYIANVKDQVFIATYSGEIYSYGETLKLEYRHHHPFIYHNFLRIAPGFDDDCLIFYSSDRQLQESHLFSIKNGTVQNR